MTPDSNIDRLAAAFIADARAYAGGDPARQVEYLARFAAILSRFISHGIMHGVQVRTGNPESIGK